MKKCLLLALFFIFPLTNSLAADDNVSSQLKQMSDDLNLLKASLSKVNANQVRLGSQEADISTINDFLYGFYPRLSQSLQSLNIYLTRQQNLGLTWQDQSTSPDTWFNASSSPGKPINICRTTFLGADHQSKAIYPGQITTSGCRITYAGFAFTISDYQVLTGKGNNLQWMTIAQVNALFNLDKTPSKTNPDMNRGNAFGEPLSTPSGSSGLFGNVGMVAPLDEYPLYHLKPVMNTPLPVAGGSDIGNPVYICRTTLNNATIVGKLVVFRGGDGRQHAACNIGVADKEVVDQDNFELLLAK